MKARSVWSRALRAAYFTKENKLPSISVPYYSTGSNPGQWVIRVSGADPVSTLIAIPWSRSQTTFSVFTCGEGLGTSYLSDGRYQRIGSFNSLANCFGTYSYVSS